MGRETNKPAPKIQHVIAPPKPKAAPTATLQKTMTSKSCTERIVKGNNLTEPRPRTTSMKKESKPKSKEIGTVPMPSAASKSAKKPSWMRRPKPAHSGVPLPEKMKKALEKLLKTDWWKL